VAPCRGQRFFEMISTAIRSRPNQWGCEVADSGDQPAADDGTEPDPRFTFANERTFLAWSRTALALVVAGLGVVQLLPPFPGVPWGRHVLGVPLIVFGAVVAVTAYREWTKSQWAMRHGQPLPRSVMPTVMTGIIAAMALVSAVVVLVSALR
jgi:putative membrane protein